MKKYVLIISIFIFALFSNLKAADMTILINDTTTTSGLISLPIMGSTNYVDNKKVEYHFELSGFPIQIFSITGGDDFGATDTALSYTFSEENGIYHLVVTTNSLQSNFFGRLFNLQINLYPTIDFYYSDRINLDIKPLYVDIDGVKNDFMSSSSGKILIQPIDAIQTYKEGISYNYPNPFSYETVIFFSIEENTPIKLKIFNYAGSLIQTIPGEIEDFSFWFYAASREKLEVNDGYIFKRGLYKLVLHPKEWTVPMGSYYLVFETNKNTYNQNILYVK